ncbi:MAG: hypothetical protein JNM66_30870 [Bryobacterales bacterium]|nr:hypothetical protein [Bryobacterales bacterium]
MATSAPAVSVSREIFDLIRGRESNFPFPVKKRTVTVGTFDAATGKFSYAVSKYTEEVDLGNGKPPKKLTGGRTAVLNAVEVALQFKFKNRTGEVVLAIRGKAPLRTSSDSITVSIGAADQVLFTISSGARKFTSELPLEVARTMAAAGAFEMPAFPIAIIYAPPVDEGRRNASKWTVTKSTGNTTSFSIGKETGTTKPVTPDFDNVNLLATEMKATAKALELLNKTKSFGGDKTVAGVIEGLTAIAGALGTASATETDSVSTVTETSMTLSISREQTISTTAASGGPGRGDLIYYLKNAKLAWFATSVGRVKVTVFGHDGLGVTSVGFLKDGGETDLDAATVEEFLKLDPFVAGGPGAALPAERYVYLDTIDLNGGEITQTESYSITRTDAKRTVRTNSRVQKNTKGLLGFLGLGVTDDTTTETKLTHSSAVQNEVSQAISNTVSLAAQPAERYSVEVYCDVVFGTFAYRAVPSGGTPSLTGTVAGGAGKLVTLMSNGRKFTTRADGEGRYAFHAAAIRPGRAELIVGGVTRQSFVLEAGGARRDL